MRLLYIANIRVPSEKAHTFQIMRMCAAFATAGADVTLAAPERRNNPVASDPFAFYGLPRSFRLVRLPAANTIGGRLPGHLALGLALFSFLFSVKRFLRREGPFDAVYTREAWLLPFLGGKHLLAYEAHDLPGGGRWFFRRGLRKASVITATSDALARKLSAFGARNVVIERNGVDNDTFGVERVSSDNAKIVLYAGQLQAWKGIGTLLAASRLLAPDVRVVLVGGLEQDIQKWKAAVPDARADFVGLRPREEIPSWLAKAQVCVVPNSANTHESVNFTSPIKLYEYLASGCPVVASDLPSLREIIDEQVAVFAEPDDPKSLAGAIRRVLDEPEAARERARRGKTLVRERYGWNARAERILARCL